MLQTEINSAGKISNKEKLYDPRFINATVDVHILQEPMFNVRAKLYGPGGGYQKYIQTESGCRVQLKGMRVRVRA